MDARLLPDISEVVPLYARYYVDVEENLIIGKKKMMLSHCLSYTRL